MLHAPLASLVISTKTSPLCPQPSPLQAQQDETESLELVSTATVGKLAAIVAGNARTDE